METLQVGIQVARCSNSEGALAFFKVGGDAAIIIDTTYLDYLDQSEFGVAQQ